MPLFALMFPVTIVTVLVVIVLAVIATFQKESDRKFTGVGIVLAGTHFLALMAVTLSVVQIGFAGITQLIPDTLVDSGWQLREAVDSARVALAALLITTPIYLVMVWKGGQAAAKGTTWSKRFLSATVLLVAALVVVGTLVTLVYNFLSGELGLRLFAQISFLLFVAGGVGAYYQIFVREKAKNAMMATKSFTVIAFLMIVMMIVWGFVVTGGPAGARAERFDDKRLSDLSSIQSQVNSYFQEYGELPDNLTELHDASRNYALPVDPRTEEPYGYDAGQITTETLEDGMTRKVATFSICANFETERDREDNKGVYQDRDSISMESGFLPGYYVGDDSPFWNHPEGEHCFERTIKENNFDNPKMMIN